MATIQIQKDHSLSAAEAKTAVTSFDELLSKYRVKLDWSGNTAKVKGIGVGGDVVVTDRDVRIKLELGMLARAAGVDAGKLEASLRKRLDAAFAPKA